MTHINLLKLIIFIILEALFALVFKFIFKTKELTFKEKILKHTPLLKHYINLVIVSSKILKYIEILPNLLGYLINAASKLFFLVVAVEVFLKFIINTNILKKIFTILSSNNPHILLNNRIENN